MQAGLRAEMNAFVKRFWIDLTRFLGAIGL
jgi:hypothetical protein